MDRAKREAILRPSCKGFDLCPCKPWRVAAAPRDMSDATARELGTRNHEVIAAYLDRNAPNLTMSTEELWIAKSCQAYAARQISLACTIRTDTLDETCHIGPLLEESVIVPFMYYSDGSPYQGRIDYLYFIRCAGGWQAVIIDWKTGRLIDDTPASLDTQLIFYALAVFDHFRSVVGGDGELFSVRACRHYPYSPDASTETVLTADRLPQVRGAAEAMCKRAGPDAEAVAGEAQCLYCAAQEGCPEWLEWTKDNVCRALEVVNDDLTIEQTAEVYALRGAVDMAQKAIESAKKRMIHCLLRGDRIEVPGQPEKVYAIKPGIKKRVIAEERRLSFYARLVDAGYTVDQFAHAMKPTLGALDVMIGKDYGGKAKGTERLSEIAGDAMELVESKPSIRIEKEATAELISTSGNGGTRK